ncbi:MAG: hypothetical protein ACXAC7_18380 [Candidatus Hodarchaeales archaeon]|jgi:hypothetical protein
MAADPQRLYLVNVGIEPKARKLLDNEKIGKQTLIKAQFLSTVTKPKFLFVSGALIASFSLLSYFF